MRIKQLIIAAAFLASIMPYPSQAQIVREDGVKSIAGMLVPGTLEAAEWTFKSSGGEILFATLDAEIYRSQRGEDQEMTVSEGGGCSEEGGPGLFYIEVVRPTDGSVLCHAEKPLPPPGWQRDPRMACMLPATKGEVNYVLRVGLLQTGEATQPYYSYMLNISMRGIAPSGTNIQSAIAGSSANGF